MFSFFMGVYTKKTERLETVMAELNNTHSINKSTFGRAQIFHKNSRLSAQSFFVVVVVARSFTFDIRTISLVENKTEKLSNASVPLSLLVYVLFIYVQMFYHFKVKSIKCLLQHAHETYASDMNFEQNDYFHVSSHRSRFMNQMRCCLRPKRNVMFFIISVSAFCLYVCLFFSVAFASLRLTFIKCDADPRFMRFPYLLLSFSFFLFSLSLFTFYFFWTSIFESMLF